MNKVTLVEEGDNLILPIGEAVMAELGWVVGDTIEFAPREDGSIVLSKKKAEKVYVMIDTVSSFKTRYVYLVDSDKTYKALDDVSFGDDPSEFSQEHAGETIVGWDVMSKEQILEAFDKENAFASAWSREAKLKNIKEL